MRVYAFVGIFVLSIFLTFSFANSQPGKRHQQGTLSFALTFEERVAYQGAIEEVYWRHRIWPSENKTTKPRLDQVIPDSQIRAKVEDYLKKSNALAEYWQRPIQPDQLQAEIDRMIKNTKQPQILSELFAALGNSPQVIAECLARPVLVDRFIQNWYSNDPRFHGALQQRIESELRGATVGSLRALSGRYSESEIVKGTDPRQERKTLRLSEDEWNENVANLERLFSSRDPIGKVSNLQQDTDRFYVVSILQKDNTRMKTAVVEWPKKSFDQWWAAEKVRINTNIVESPFVYNMSPVPNTPTSCSPADHWTPINESRVPIGRWSAVSVWTGSEMIVWGGRNIENAVLNTGGRYNPATDTWSPISMNGVPEGRINFTAVWSGTEMIVWGGLGSAYFSTGGRYNPSTDTWTATSSTNAPSGRQNHVAVWTNTEMIVWGGRSGISLLGDGGRYDPSTDTWSNVQTLNAPDPRADSAAVWTGSEMIIWGGSGNAGDLSSGGRYNSATDSWAAISNFNAPDARANHTAVWLGNKMVVWGGGGSSHPVKFSGGRYDPSTDTWTATNLIGAPEGRYYHTAISTGTEMIIWGGNNGLSPLSNGGRYNPSSDTWTATDTSGAPQARSLHNAVWSGTEMIIWGGLDGYQAFFSGGRYDPITDRWVSTSTSDAPSARYFHTAVWTGAEMLIWGGTSGNGAVLSAGRSYNPAMDSWVAISNVNEPQPRYAHEALWTGTQMIVWGGADPYNALGTGSRYDPVSNSWSPVSTTNAPSPRFNHTAVWTGYEMIIWGGSNGFTVFSTGGRYDPASDSWTVTSSGPSARRAHSALWTASVMLVWGGFYNDTQGEIYFSDGYYYVPDYDTWYPISTSNAPSGRAFHSAVWAANKSQMIIWGGFTTSTGFLNSGGVYDLLTNSWTTISMNNAPTPRTNESAIWANDFMVVWGGCDDFTYFSSGGRYDPTSNSWFATNMTNAPAARCGHSGVWTGTEMIVWGGTNGSALGSGARYCVAGSYPTLSINDATVVEGNSGTTSLNFTVTQSESVTYDVSVHYQTADSTATDADNDYEPVSGTLTIPAGQTQGVITVPVNDDTKFESDEMLVVNLSSPAKATIADNQGTGNILNDDSQPAISIQDPFITPEGNSGITPTNFVVTLSSASGFNTYIDYATADSTATASSGDYISTSGTLLIPAGSTFATIQVFVNGDTILEPDETFVVNLSNPVNGTIFDGTGVGTIGNDESPTAPFLTITDVSKKEGGKVGNTTSFTFTVNLSVMLGTPVSVQYATADGTATVAGNDYVATSGSVTIPARTTKTTITVQVKQDKTFEQNETFFVNLSNSSGGVVIQDPQGIGTIVNDD